MMETENGNAGVAKWVVMGVVALVIINAVKKLFASIGEGTGLVDPPEVKAGAALFMDTQAMPELWDPNALYTAIGAGKVTVPDIDKVTPYAATIDQAVNLYRNAKGVIYDNESDAIQAVGMMPGHVALLVMAQNFANNYGTTLGGYGASFLANKDKAAISKIVSNLRTK